MKDDLIPMECVNAIQEQLCGFLLDKVINPKGEFYDDGKIYRPENPVGADDEQF